MDSPLVKRGELEGEKNAHHLLCDHYQINNQGAARLDGARGALWHYFLCRNHINIYIVAVLIEE